MKELKLRYWHIEHKEFIKNYDVYFISQDCILAGDLDNPPVVDITRLVIVNEYTGLKDKNGSEIYEGDIVKFHYKTGVYKTGSVVWNDLTGSWCIDCEDFNAYKSLGTFVGVSEIISNIYEPK